MLDLIPSDKDPFYVEVNYWKEKLMDVVPLNLGIDISGANLLATVEAEIESVIDENAISILTKLSNTQQTDLFAVLLSVFKVLLFRYSSQEDICVGNPVPDQSGDNFNTVALRSSLHGEDRFTDLLKQVSSTVTEAYEHQNIPFAIVLDSLLKEGEALSNPLFQVLFILQEESDPIQPEALSQQTGKYDLAFILNRAPSGYVSIKIEYTTGLYQKATIERMAEHYKQLLHSIIANPEEKIGVLPMLTCSEHRELLEVFNNTEKAYAKEATLQSIFEAQAKSTPGNIALRQHEQTMSYGELNEKANRLASYLVAQGVKPGDNVGLLVTRGFDMITGMYGILKAGGAYVPIDPEYPLERQEYILENSLVNKVLTDGNYELTNKLSAERSIQISTLDLSSYSTDNLALKIDSKQLAYTIYTSGSTGRPKGVMIEHHSAVNLVSWVNTEFNVGEDDRLLFITSMCFDLSVYDIFGILASGGSLVIVEQQELMDVPKLKEMLQSYGITFWDSVPTTMDYLVRELEEHDTTYLQETLRIVFMSGDWIPVNLPDRIKQYFPKTRVISLGGATEGTIWSNYYPVEKVEASWSSIPYGRPMDNNFFYILNDQQQPVPIGVAGELYIGGVGVARGYANDPEKTAYSFVKDPFNTRLGGMMYRTGDLGRMLPGLNM
ncbi:MAG: amino acid adenylation domain-containing protein, partial [Mucilaginibacter sp.]